MALVLNIGQSVDLTIAYLDQSGQPMSPVPTPDSPPTWANSTPAVDTLAPSSDGSSATDTAVTAGTDNVNMTVSVGGKSFAASLAITVTPPAQILTSVEIVAGTPTGAVALPTV